MLPTIRVKLLNIPLLKKLRDMLKKFKKLIFDTFL